MGRAAEASLEHLDKVLAERPNRVDRDFSEATRWIAAYRDELASEWRRTGSAIDRQRLNTLNSVLSVVIGGHYPLGDVPWDLIEQARAQLASVASAAATEPIAERTV